MKLSEAFMSPQSRIEATVMFVDMTNSTEMKEKESEASWLNSYAMFFDCIAEEIPASEGGDVVKYLGDGLMAFFDSDKSTGAINSAIRIQEAIAQRNRDQRIKCLCSIGLATGEMVKFKTAQDNDDYIGSIVDKAAKPCQASSPNAIFVDEATID